VKPADEDGGGDKDDGREAEGAERTGIGYPEERGRRIGVEEEKERGAQGEEKAQGEGGESEPALRVRGGEPHRDHGKEREVEKGRAQIKRGGLEDKK